MNRSALAVLRRLAPLLAAVGFCERMSRDVALRQSALAPSAPLAGVLRSQSRQEALHALVFEAATLSVRPHAICPPGLARALAAFSARLHADLDAGALAASMIGLQCIFEDLACVALEVPPGELERVGDRFVPLLALVRRQEAAHSRLGHVWVPRLAQLASEVERRSLQRAHACYAELAEDATQAALSAFEGGAADRAHYDAAIGASLEMVRRSVDTFVCGAVPS